MSQKTPLQGNGSKISAEKLSKANISSMVGIQNTGETPGRKLRRRNTVKFFKNDYGITMTEYILILFLIAVAGIFSFVILGDALSSNINSISNTF